MEESQFFVKITSLTQLREQLQAELKCLENSLKVMEKDIYLILDLINEIDESNKIQENCGLIEFEEESTLNINTLQ